MSENVNTHEMMEAGANLGSTLTGLSSASSSGRISYKARMEAVTRYSVDNAM